MGAGWVVVANAAMGGDVTSKADGKGTPVEAGPPAELGRGL
jgi:hypothetical protein